MRVVLLSAKQGGGKSSIQKALAEKWSERTGQAVACLNFADVLYEMHDAVLEVLHRYWPNRNLAKDGPLLQMLGTDWARKTIDQDIWVKCMQKKAELWFRENPGGLLIVGDCRFENELHAFPEALRVRLNCPEKVRQARCSMWRENTEHPSEIGLDGAAERGEFDMYLNTETTPVDGCVSLLVVGLEKNDWVNRRKT